jgi:hypothetical protein
MTTQQRPDASRPERAEAEGVPVKKRSWLLVDDDEPLPSLSEQVSQQLGGARGLIESSIPVLVFVLLNFVASRFDLWSLRTTTIVAVGFSLAVAGFRLTRHQPIRHALNGVFGIALGAAFALNSGEARDFHLPAIYFTAGYAIALAVSMVARRPLVGWIWSVMLDGGATRWYREASLLRLFTRLTSLWVLIYASKVVVQVWLFTSHRDDWLGIVRIVFGWPPYALLLALTIWSARRVIRRERLAA